MHKAKDETEPNNILTFDNANDLKKIYSLKGKLSITNKHYIKKNSLRWDYDLNDTLVINETINNVDSKITNTFRIGDREYYLYSKPFGFSGFVYSEEKTSSKLIFEFGKNDEVNCSFDFLINYVGWRHIQIPFNRGLMKGKAKPGMEWLRIRVETDKPGTIFLAQIHLGCIISPNNIEATKQMPNLWMHPQRKCNGDWYINDTYLNKPLFPPNKEITKEEIDSFNIIEKNYINLIDEIDYRDFPWINGDEDEICKGYNSFNINYKDGVITGKYISMEDSYALCSLMGKTAAKYRETKKDKFLYMFLNMFRHAVDQDIMIRWYNTRGFATGLLLMKDVLKEYNLLDLAINYLREKFEFYRIYDTTCIKGRMGAKGENTDDSFFSLPSMIVSVLLLDNSPKKVQDMRLLVNYIQDISLGYGPGLVSSYKPDGTSLHHGTFIFQYHDVANLTISRLFRIFSNTIFELDSKTNEKFQHILRTEYFIRNGLYEPFTTSHYAFDHKKYTGIKHFANYAVYRLEKNEKDIEFATMYMNLASSSKEEQQCKYYIKFKEMGIKPAKYPSGHKTLTYSAAAFHRRKDWAVGVKGHSRYVYPMEVWPGDRYVAYSMFRSYGFTEILYPANDKTNGLNNGLNINKGFDWCRWPGSTSINMPLEMIKSVPLNHGDEFAEMLFSDQHFVGGLDSIDGNGIFVMKLRGHDKYGMESFFATKSYFYFDDYIVCLGTNISYDKNEYHVETTLFQNYLENESDEIIINNKNKIIAFPFKSSMKTKEPIWILDNRNNGYYIFENQNVNIEKKYNYSMDSRGEKTTAGNRAMAWIDHGHSPQNEKYRYILNINSTKERLQKFYDKMNSNEKPFDIIQQNDKAHIVRSSQYKTTSYIFFEKNYELKDNLLLSVTQPCIMMISENGTDKLNFSICDPDLRFYEGICEDYNLDYTREERSIYGRTWFANESKQSIIRVKIQKKWEIDNIYDGNGKVIFSNDECTILEFKCQHGLTNKISLKKY